MGGSLTMKKGRIDKFLFGGGYAQASVASSTTDNFAFYFYNQDHLGNIHEVVDASGTVKQVTNYYPFGAPYADTAGSTNPDFQPYKYNGKELDKMHGLNTYDYGARQHDPILARWDKIDPLCEKYYSVSPYVYCGDNPIKNIDPDGCRIRVYKKNQAQVLGYINKLAQGTFAIDKNGYLFLKQSTKTKGFSSTYTKSLMRAINNKEKTINIYVDDYYYDANGEKQDISRKGEGTTKEFFNGDISVVISGKSYDGLVDKDGNKISDGPEYILAHEIAGHAEPRLNDDGNGKVINSVEIENTIRRETNEKERKEEPGHDQ
jgi:RHS repeat-associated protein